MLMTVLLNKREIDMSNCKDVVGFEGRYVVYADGRIQNVQTERFLKPFSNGYGYMYVALGAYGKKGSTNGMAKPRPKKFGVHRIVAQAFLPNPEGKPEVDHLDEDKGNNAVTNLEWVTASENSTRRAKNVSEETRKAYGHNIKTWHFINPEGELVQVTNLKAWCRDNGYKYHVFKPSQYNLNKANEYGWIVNF